MKIDDRKYLISLIREGEHQQQDFKYGVADPMKLARSVSAFANTDGGRLLIGVRDDGLLSGVRSEEEIYVMHQAAYRYCQPEASIKFDIFHVGIGDKKVGYGKGHVDNRTIVMATIPRSERRPVCAIDEKGRRRAYVRVKDENIVASPVHLAIWREEQQLHGASFTYSEENRTFLHSMSSDNPLTVTQIVRRSRLPRHRVIVLLARMIRYGLVQLQLIDQQFRFSLT